MPKVEKLIHRRSTGVENYAARMEIFDAEDMPDEAPTDARLIRPDPAKSALEDCVSMIGVLREALNSSPKKDAALARELRAYEDRRLELEDRVATESAGMFFPPGMTKAQIISSLTEMLERAESLPD